MKINPDSEIDLKSILRALRNGLKILILIPLLSTILSLCINIFYLTPVYQGSVTLVAGKVSSRDDKLLYDDLLIAKQLLNTYCCIAKSRSVAEQVIAKNSLSITAENLDHKISVNVIRDTQIISLYVTDPDPALAAHLANDTAEVLIEEGKRIMEFSNLKIIDRAKVPEKPIKPNIMFNVLLSFGLSFFLSIFIVFMKQLVQQMPGNDSRRQRP